MKLRYLLLILICACAGTEVYSRGGGRGGGGRGHGGGGRGHGGGGRHHGGGRGYYGRGGYGRGYGGWGLGLGLGVGYGLGSSYYGSGYYNNCNWVLVDGVWTRRCPYYW